MDLVWQIMNDLPNFPPIQYIVFHNNKIGVAEFVGT